MNTRTNASGKGGTCKQIKTVSGVTHTCVLPKHSQKKHNDGTNDWWETNDRDKGKGSVFPLSDGRYAAELVIDGKKVRRSAKTEGMANEILLTMRRKVTAGEAVQSKSQSVATWLTFWLKTLAKHKPKTAETNRSLVNKHIIKTIGTVRLDSLTPQHVRNVEAAILALDLSPSTALRAHSVLDTAMDAAWREGLISENPVKRAVRPRKAAGSVAMVTRDDAMKIVSASEGERLITRIMMAFWTGARQGELLGLEIDRVDFIKGTIDLSWQLQALSWQHGCGISCGRKRGTDCPNRKLNAPADWEHRHLTGTLYLSRPKSKAGKRLLYLAPAAAYVLEQRVAVAMTEPNPFGLVWTSDPKKDKHGRVLPLDGSPINPSQDSRAWHDALVRADVPTAPLHAARHTTASQMLANKNSSTVITETLGHNKYATSEIYMNKDKVLALEAMQGITSAMPFELKQAVAKPL
jgi:integrase